MRTNCPIPHNVRSSGPLVSANSDDGVAIFTGYDLEPGDVRSGKVTILNKGAVAGRFRLSEADASDTFPRGDLMLAIEDITDSHPVAIFLGSVGGLPSEGIDLGRFEPGQSRRFRFLVILDLNSRSGGQELGAGAVYEWGAAPEGRTGAASRTDSSDDLPAPIPASHRNRSAPPGE